MLQQILAFIVIAFFLIRLFKQRNKKQISGNEFLLWLIFWIISLAAIIFIKQIDYLLAIFGFSGAAINFLVYVVVLALIYQVFQMSLKIAKLDKNLSDINQALALKK
jgi:hypothetical protein